MASTADSLCHFSRRGLSSFATTRVDAFRTSRGDARDFNAGTQIEMEACHENKNYSHSRALHRDHIDFHCSTAAIAAKRGADQRRRQPVSDKSDWRGGRLTLE